MTQLFRLTTNAMLLGLWLWLYWPVVDDLAHKFTNDDFRTNQLAFMGVLALIGWQAYHSRRLPPLDSLPRLTVIPLLFALVGSLAYLATERFLDVNTLSSTLFGLASYGLIGLWMTPKTWRRGLPMALLLISTLPFDKHLETFVGYPMRLLTASIVQDGLAAAGIATIGLETILVFENGISHIDLPCSGIKSLWAGMLFLLAASWVEQRRLNLSWLVITTLFVGLLFFANLTRVAILIAVGEVAGWSLVAEMLHVPLGVLGFMLACAVTVSLLRLTQRPSPEACPPTLPPKGEAGLLSSRVLECDRFSCRQKAATAKAVALQIFARFGQNLPALPKGEEASSPSLWEGGRGRAVGASFWQQPFKYHHNSPAQPRWLSPLLMLLIAGMALLYTPRLQTDMAAAPATWQFPAEMVTAPLPLAPDALDWLQEDGAESVARLRFEWQDVSGSMILITSRTWRAHHKPERCLQIGGFVLSNFRSQLVATDFPIRRVSLTHLNGATHSAAYWFQSADRITEDHGSRIWADLNHDRERWVLVSILFDGPAPSAAHGQQFYQLLRHTVAQNLQPSS